jgi:hypothetical protein
VKQTIEKKDEPDDEAEWLMVSLTTSSSSPDEVFGRDRSILGRLSWDFLSLYSPI